MHGEPIVTPLMDMGTVLFMATVLAFVILIFPRLYRRTARQREGWKYLTVSVAEWTICAISFGLTCVLIWAYGFVGSARSDAASQMLACGLLLVVLAPITAMAWWQTFSSFTRWNNDCIEQDTIIVGVRTIPFGNIVRVRTVANTMYIEATNGQRMQVPLLHNGAHEFLKFLSSRFERKSADSAAGL